MNVCGISTVVNRLQKDLCAQEILNRNLIRVSVERKNRENNRKAKSSGYYLDAYEVDKMFYNGIRHDIYTTNYIWDVYFEADYARKMWYMNFM